MERREQDRRHWETTNEGSYYDRDRYRRPDDRSSSFYDSDAGHGRRRGEERRFDREPRDDRHFMRGGSWYDGERRREEWSGEHRPEYRHDERGREARGYTGRNDRDYDRPDRYSGRYDERSSPGRYREEYDDRRSRDSRDDDRYGRYDRRGAVHLQHPERREEERRRYEERDRRDLDPRSFDEYRGRDWGFSWTDGSNDDTWRNMDRWGNDYSDHWRSEGFGWNRGSSRDQHFWSSPDRER